MQNRQDVLCRIALTITTLNSPLQTICYAKNHCITWHIEIEFKCVLVDIDFIHANLNIPRQVKIAISFIYNIAAGVCQDIKKYKKMKLANPSSYDHPSNGFGPHKSHVLKRHFKMRIKLFRAEIIRCVKEFII